MILCNSVGIGSCELCNIVALFVACQVTRTRQCRLHSARISDSRQSTVLGKLLVAVGEDNVLWGTDAIWYGPSQVAIDAFRAFQIPASMREQYGYLEMVRDDPGSWRGQMVALDPSAWAEYLPTCGAEGADEATSPQGRDFLADSNRHVPRTAARQTRSAHVMDDSSSPGGATRAGPVSASPGGGSAAVVIEVELLRSH